MLSLASKMSSLPVPHQYQVWVQQQLAARVLDEVGRALDRAAVRWVPVKGVVLARWLYADVSERDLADVDILVPRSQFCKAEKVLVANGWHITYRSRELGELVAHLRSFTVELHCEFARRDLTSISIDEVIDRCSLDCEMFEFPTLRLDDIDHLLLVAANVAKDWFIHASPHHAEDIARMLDRLRGREPEIVARAYSAAFATGLFNVIHWLAIQRVDQRAQPLFIALGRSRRRLQPFLARLCARLPTLALNFAVASLTNDEPLRRFRSLERIVRRGAWNLGRERLRWVAVFLAPSHRSHP